MNFKSASTFNVSEFLSSILINDLELEYKYNIYDLWNVKNIYEFVDEVRIMNVMSSYRLMSFDISSLYKNVTVILVKCRLKNNRLEKLIKTNL